MNGKGLSILFFLSMIMSRNIYLLNIDWNSQIPLKKQLFGSKYPVNQNSYILAVESNRVTFEAITGL